MSEFWGGPISATVFVSSRNAEAEIKLLVQTWLSSTYLWSFVDIHVAFAPFQSEQSRFVCSSSMTSYAFSNSDEYHSTGASTENASASKKFPINFLRNVAIQNARTALVLSLDVDFITSALLHPSLRSLRDVLIGSEKTIFLIPAFQATASFNITNAPKLKRDAKSQVSFATASFAIADSTHQTRFFRYWMLIQQWFHSTIPSSITIGGSKTIPSGSSPFQQIANSFHST